MKEKRICCFTRHRPQNLPFVFDEQDVRCVAPKWELNVPIMEHGEGGEGR